VIKLSPGYYVADSLEKVSADIEGIEGVFEVTYVEKLINTVLENITRISLILLGIAIMLVIVVVVLINNTIKLALFSQRFLIRSMQLVGATSSFIKRPFLGRAFMHGIFAGLIASALLYWLLQLAYNNLPELQILANTELTLLLLGGIVVFGGLLGWLSTRGAMSRYLKLSLDELY
jgi:cell division transport system permease protein